MKQYQAYQGDVSLIRANSEIRKFAKKVSFTSLPENGLVVAEGEVTGHKHVIVKETEDAVIDFGQDQNGYYLNVKKGNAVITHEEHKHQTLGEGLWFVGKQWEYSNLEDRQVID